MARVAKKAAPEKSFEQRPWDTADALRGNQEPSEYKQLVLGLVFLKYISDRFETRRKDLAAELEQYGVLENRWGQFLEDREEYSSHNVFWVPADARWEAIQARAELSTIGSDIDTAMDLIEKRNPVIRGVLPRNYGREGLDKGRLGQLVDLIGSIGFTTSDDHGSDDVLGRVYECFLGQFAGKETGKDAGAFYTPRSVVRTLVEMLEPCKGRVYDPACGSDGMFVQSAEFVQAHGGKRNDISVYGQECTDTTWRPAKMNLAVRGIEADLVDCIVAMPEKLFFNTGIPVSLWFVSKDRHGDIHCDRRGEVLFIDARKLGHMESRRQVETADELFHAIWRRFSDGPDCVTERRLADLVDTQYGLTASATTDPNGVKFLRVTDINKLNWIEWPEVPTVPAVDADGGKYRLRKGDLVVARMAGPGKSAIYEDEAVDAVFASYQVRLKPESYGAGLFLFGFLKSTEYLDDSAGATTGSVQKNMNAQVTVGTSVRWPSESALLGFARSVAPLRDLVVGRVREIASLTGLRDALLPGLLAGRIRVPIDAGFPDRAQELESN